jgi:hypothetical protein
MALDLVVGVPTVSWTGPGVLQQASAASNTWQEVIGPATPYAMAPTNHARVFRCRVPPYAVVDTGQTNCYDELTAVSPPATNDALHGQDAQYAGSPPSYVISQDGLTVFDRNTGLTWQRTTDRDGDGDIDAADKLSWTDALDHPATANAAGYGGYHDWQLPTIKQLYSLIDFRGLDPSGYTGTGVSGLVPYIDTNYFDFGYGDTGASERIIDAQYWSSTEYVSTTMNGDPTAFGVNFADGRIKGYPTAPIGPPGNQFTMTAYVVLVRSNSTYGVNDFVDNRDGTVTDLATGLMWQQDDSGTTQNWARALAYAEALDLAGHRDWRLPTAKELQSIVDYTRSPDTTSSAAIDPVFTSSAIIDAGGRTNYPFYWTSTTHANWTTSPGRSAVYIAFGEALGWMQPPGGGDYVLLDVHGAGAQRSDPKSGNPADWPNGHGPQGDVIRIYHHVRCVRGGAAKH